MRVKADMPEWVSVATQCVWYVFLFLIALSMIVHGGIKCNSYEKGRYKPSPMKEGKCTEVPLKRYEGNQENGQSCDWRGTKYWCSPSEHRAWICEQQAEKQ